MNRIAGISTFNRGHGRPGVIGASSRIFQNSAAINVSQIRHCPICANSQRKSRSRSCQGGSRTRSDIRADIGRVCSKLIVIQVDFCMIPNLQSSAICSGSVGCQSFPCSRVVNRHNRYNLKSRIGKGCAGGITITAAAGEIGGI